MKAPNLKIFITSGIVLFIILVAEHTPTISFLYEKTNFFPAICFRLFAFFLALLLLSSFYGIGSLFCPLIGISKIQKYLEIPVYFFIGFIISSSIVYILGFLEILKREIFICIVFFGTVLTVRKLVKNPLDLFPTKKISKLETFEKLVWFTIIFFLIGRLFPVLNFNSFGDPLFYNLPVGRDYLRAGGFKWFEHAEFYWQAGLSDIGLIYLHSLTSHPMLVQLTAQAFYYLSGALFLIYILHKGLFSEFFPEKNNLWISFSFISMSTFRMESIVAKSDYWLAILLCLIIVFLYEALKERHQKIRLQYLKLILLFAGLCFSIKITSILFLLPFSVGILIFGSKIIPWKSLSFWIFLIVATVLSLLNSFKNQYIFESPIIPFASDIFPSPYWDKEGLEGIRNLSTIEKGDLLDFPNVFFQFLLGHPVSIFLVLITLIWWSKYKTIETIPDHLKKLEKIISLSWLVSLLLWLSFLGPLVNTRYIIGFVFLTLLLPTIIATNQLAPIFNQNNQKWQNSVVGISILLTLGVSHIDLDLQQAKHWISSKSFHQHWMDSSSLAEVQNFLNNHVTPSTRVLFHYTTQRFHANFIVYGARSFSPRTRFVSSKDRIEIMKGLKGIKPEYYVIRKDKIGFSSGLLAKKDFLDENFILLKIFKDYLLYKVPEDLEIY